MDSTTSYIMIASSVILIISYFFNEISRKTSIPSVLLLIVLGMVTNAFLQARDIQLMEFTPLLGVLGTVGLIMIVLEAALELHLDRDKIVPIAKAFFIALAGLLLTTWATAEVLKYFYPTMSGIQAWVYSTPLCILSSAIIIPSVQELRSDKKEFHIYESTFSDILGIMLFYFLTPLLPASGDLGGVEVTSSDLGSYGLTTLITIVISMLLSYLIIIVFQNIRTNVKLFLLISVLLLLYSLGKMMHLSSLIIILTFGLMISNPELAFSGPMKKFIDPKKVKDMYNGLHVLTMETSFVVRTYFFFIFGMTINVSSLGNVQVLGLSAILIAIVYIVRFICLRTSIGKDIIPQVFIAPRGLITILLFANIPAVAIHDLFNQDMLFIIIIGTSLIMTFAMIYDKNRAQKIIQNMQKGSIGDIKWRAPDL